MPDTQSTAAVSPEALLPQAEEALALALTAGADDAVAKVVRSRGADFTWRDGRLEDVQESASRALSLSLYVDGRFSTHTTNDLEPTRLIAFVDEAVALTRHLEPDPHRVLPDPALYAGRADVDLDLVDARIVASTQADHVEACRAMNDAACADEQVVSATSKTQDRHSLLAQVSSNGFSGAQETTTLFYFTRVTLREGETRRPEDSWYAGGTHLDDLPAAEEVGQEALRRALGRLGSRKVASRSTRMVVTPEAGASLIGRVLGALFAGSVQQKRSFLAEKAGAKVAAPILTCEDDPLVVRGQASRLFDGEGIAAQRRAVIEDGVLTSFFVDTYYGRKLGWEPTSGSPSNVVFRHGDKDLQGIVEDVSDGILVTSWLGGNANLTSGDFSFGVQGNVIADGAVAEPISEMNVTGSYLDLLGRLVAVGNDPVPWYACRTPTLLFDGVDFSGTN